MPDLSDGNYYSSFVSFINSTEAIVNQTSTRSSISYNVGDSIFFGAIDQDNDTLNGAENIEWLIIDQRGEQILVISRYALACMPFNNTATEISWENCSLRNWLNNSFIQNAFSPEEQQQIMTMNSPLSDKVFLLSIKEVSSYFESATARMTGATKTAVANGSYQENGICGWWLRDSGDTNRIAARVNKNGEIVTYDSTEGGVERKDYSVRPSMWIAIN